jgi:hypothetical protein
MIQRRGFVFAIAVSLPIQRAAAQVHFSTTELAVKLRRGLFARVDSPGASQYTVFSFSGFRLAFLSMERCHEGPLPALQRRTEGS